MDVCLNDFPETQRSCWHSRDLFSLFRLRKCAAQAKWKANNFLVLIPHLNHRFSLYSCSLSFPELQRGRGKYGFCRFQFKSYFFFRKVIMDLEADKTTLYIKTILCWNDPGTPGNPSGRTSDAYLRSDKDKQCQVRTMFSHIKRLQSQWILFTKIIVLAIITACVLYLRKLTIIPVCSVNNQTT